MESNRNPIVIGAGPAGLTAALELTKRGVTPRIYESSGYVGGLARTPTNGDWRVDPGGHRFFTTTEAVSDLWKSLLPAEQWTSVHRHSAMLVDGHLVRYPLEGRDLVTQLGYRRGMRGLGSLLWSRLQRGTRVVSDSSNFREWGTDEFGRYWYEMFFDGYVRKTWLAEPIDLTSQWANQRIRPIGWRLQKSNERAARDFFSYPRRGPGQLWEAAAAALVAEGVVPSMNSTVDKVRFDDGTWTVEMHDGTTASGDAVFSSMPLRLLIDALEPKAPRRIQVSAAALRHRALITAAVPLRERHDLPYNWVYVPSRDVRVGRIQNYGRWSADLAPAGWDGTYLGFEYFTDSDDHLWKADDDEMTKIVEEDLRRLGFGAPMVERLVFVRSEYAYPVYDAVRERSVARIRRFLSQQYPTLHPIGRNGMHRYDNQDHAMLSAMHSVARYFGEDVDPWQVNTDRRHHEAGLLKG